jgi:LEA14-like dessication related protein
MKCKVLVFFALVVLSSCVPRDSIVLRDIKNLKLDQTDLENAILDGEAVFYNPNNSRMRLREINITVFVDGKKSAYVDQKLSALARAKSEFTVPVKVQLSLKELGLMNTIMSLFGGKKYELHYKGYLKVKVNGLPLRIPIDHKEDFKLKL